MSLVGISSDTSLSLVRDNKKYYCKNLRWGWGQLSCCCLDLGGHDLVCHPDCQEVLRTLVTSEGPSHGQKSHPRPPELGCEQVMDVMGMWLLHR